MKLIIDIDDNVFTRLFDNGVETSSDDRAVIDRAVRNGMPYEERLQGEWKLVSDINNDIDVVCPFCNKVRIISYAHGYSIEEVESQLQEVNDLPDYCENCGAKMKGGAE